MKTLQNLHELWQEFFLSPGLVRHMDTWCIVFAARDQAELLVSLANPFTDEYEEIVIAQVSDADAAMFVEHYKARFLEQLPHRFGFFRPGVDRVLTEYPDWQTFYEAWLNSDSRLLQSNMPLLFDYPSAYEYRATQLKEADYAGYRRLLVILYQYRKQQFQKIFVRGVDDASYAAIRGQMLTLYGNAMPQLIQRKVKP